MSEETFVKSLYSETRRLGNSYFLKAPDERHATPYEWKKQFSFLLPVAR
ncbi:MAG: hypothetical protein F6K31_43040 [Symploca sp. SIO2G7]|nr:hypothetical protein [Symploca sp. SIO2G7]